MDRKIDSQRYYRIHPLSDPAYMVTRTAGKYIETYTDRYLRGRLLDIGCGEGHKRLLLGDRIEHYVGMDRPDSLHDVSHAEIHGTAYQIPSVDASFDSILCTAVLEHLEEPLDALRESFRVLKPGGYAVYTVPLFWHIHEEPNDYFRYTCHGLEHLFRKAGYGVTEIVPLSGFWITVGSAWNYYLVSVLRAASKPLILMNNLLFPVLDRIDRKLNPASTRWTWLYLVVARKAA